jgi:hypothetical protein
MKNAVFWDGMPRGFCRNRRFGSDTFRRNVGSYKRQTASHPRTRESLSVVSVFPNSFPFIIHRDRILKLNAATSSHILCNSYLSNPTSIQLRPTYNKALLMRQGFLKGVHFINNQNFEVTLRITVPQRYNILSASYFITYTLLILKPVWTYGIQLCGTASTSNIEILERFQSVVLRVIVDAPCYVPNTVIRRDLQTPIVKEEIRHYSCQYSASLSVHPDDLVANLMAQHDSNRRSRRHLPKDLPTRF